MDATPSDTAATQGDTAATAAVASVLDGPERATAAPADATEVSHPRMDITEITALLMTLVIGGGAFAWSFAALSDLSVMAGITPKLAWVGPVFVDGAIVQSTVALVSLQRRRKVGIEIPAATMRFFWGQLALAELISIAGNGLHAAESGARVLPTLIAACVAGAAPLAGLAATHGLTALLEVPRTAPEPTAEDKTLTTTIDKTSEAIVDISATVGVAVASGRDNGATSCDTGVAQCDSGATPAVAGGDTDATASRDELILALLDAGKSAREIAVEIGVHHSTVARHIKRLRPPAEEPAAQTLRLIAGAN